MKRTALLALTVLVAAGLIEPALGQTAPPATDIYMVNIRMDGADFRIQGQPVNLTDRDGYDNQPFFAPDGRSFLYTSSSDGQTDIYRYDIANRSTHRMTSTSESEYSPTVMPDGKSFSVIRVEADGTQRLWKFPTDGGAPSLVLQEIKPVGYQAWADAKTVLIFVLGEPPTLQKADTATGKSEVIIENVGRSLHKVPGQEAVSFVHKVSEKDWQIKSLETGTGEIRTITKTLPQREDYAWTPAGTLVMARDGKLYSFYPERDKEWKEVADFASAGVRGITRLSIAPDGERLVLVSER